MLMDQHKNVMSEISRRVIRFESSKVDGFRIDKIVSKDLCHHQNCVQYGNIIDC